MIKSILCVLGFYLAYWISKSIFHSFLDDDTTIAFIIKGEWIIAGAISAFISNAVAKDEDKGLIAGGIMIALTLVAMLIPFSIGIVVLYNLVLIACIGKSAYDD